MNYKGWNNLPTNQFFIMGKQYGIKFRNSLKANETHKVTIVKGLEIVDIQDDDYFLGEIFNTTLRTIFSPMGLIVITTTNFGSKVKTCRDDGFIKIYSKNKKLLVTMV